MLHLDCLQVGDLSGVVPVKGVGLVPDLANLKNRSIRTGLVLGLTRYRFLSKRFTLYKDDVPGFPLKDASEITLSRFGFDEVVIPDPLPLPFSTADVICKKARSVYLTYARFLERGPTPGCSACENDRSHHSAECIARFEAAYGGDKWAPPTPASLPRHRCHLQSLRRIVQDALRLVLTWTLSKKFRLTLDFHRPVLVIHNLMLLQKKQMTFRQWLSSLVQMMKILHLLWLHLCIDINFLELASCTSLLVILTLCWVKLAQLVVFRLFVCAVGTLICLTTKRLINCWVQATPGASIHCSIECAPWSSWQNMNIATRGPAYQKELDAKRAESTRMLMAFIRAAAMIYHMGGEVSFEWPRYASGHFLSS